MKLNLNDLAHFTGTEHYYQHWARGLVYTDGVHHLATNGAGWLVDAIASYQFDQRLNGRLREFQLWELEAKDGKATLTCREDSGLAPAITQEIEYTDFPDGSVKLYVERGSVDGVNEVRVLMLTSER